LSTMKKGGLLGKVLLSHDAGWYRVGEPNGGTFNAFTPIFTHLIPAMEKRGFSRDDIRQLFERNPQEAYTVRIRPLRKR